jgi:hypothetical protein
MRAAEHPHERGDDISSASAYRPDVLDPVACDVERHHHHGDAVLLSHQTGLTVDPALQDRQVGYPAGDIDGVAGHRHAAAAT